MPQPRARPLGTIQLIALGLNGVIGVGIFFVPSAVAKTVPGSPGAIVYLLTAVACLPVALAFARLGRTFDEDGGPYVFARAAFGPHVAYGVGWLAYASAVFSTSAVLRGLAQSIRGQEPWMAGVATGLIAAALLAALLGPVAAGLRISAWAWTTVTVAKILPLLALLAAAILITPQVQFASAPVNVSSVTPHDVLRGVLIALFAVQGFEIVAVPAGHVRRPVSVSIATISALIAAAALYVGLHLACVRALPALSASKAPLVDAARSYGGVEFARVMGLGTTVSGLGIAFAMVAMTPRYLAALGRTDGLGSWLGACDPRGVPTRALLITAALVAGLVQFGSLEQLFALSSIGVLTQYFSTAASLVMLGARGVRGLGLPEVALGAVACGASLVVITGASWGEAVRAAVVIAAGVVLKALVSHMRGRRPSTPIAS
jgi:basic amino acid/polyamine antiporter, APA family